MFDLRTMSPLTSLPWMLGALRVALGFLVGRTVLDGARALLVHRRLGEIAGRLERMLVRFAAGRPMVRRGFERTDVARVERARERVAERGVRAMPVQVWPAGFGWALPAGYQAAGFGGHLCLIMAHPEMVALLRASPQARRLLSPVCRMLGIERSMLRPVLPGDPAPAPVVRKVRTPRVRVKVEWGDRPLPRGVMAMVRKYKKQGKFYG